MYTTITFTQFVDGFENRKDHFTYEGLKALYEYLTDLEEDTGNPLEFDPIALCCEFTQYDTFDELKENYSHIASPEDLEHYTTVIPIPNSDALIIAPF